MEIQVVENVTKLNDEIAALNRASFASARARAVNLIGAVGSGKTALVEATLPPLTRQGKKVAVVVGDLATSRDAQRIGHGTDHVVQVNTGKTCHLEAHHVRRAIEKLDLPSLRPDLVLIENVGNLICPVGFDLGESRKVGVFSVMHGDDKLAKHPQAVMACDVLVLTAIDMLPHVRFDLDAFRAEARQLNPKAALLEVSSRTGAGLDPFVRWLLDD
ncbi:MAG: hydrogenase nickel incorporation protein HypB [Tepidisphaeraceae bacterium]